MIGLAIAGATVAGLILAIAFVPSGETLQDAENDVSDGRVLFGVLCILAFIAGLAVL
jgi:hypothetical protein